MDCEVGAQVLAVTEIGVQNCLSSGCLVRD